MITSYRDNRHHNNEDHHVVVTGLMGVGKSTTAAAVAERLGWSWYDSDADIQTLFGSTGGEIAHEHGVPELHRLEAAVLLGRLASDTPSVIAAAASVVDNPWCSQAMARRSFAVVLQAPVAEIVRRAATGDHRRPITADEVERLAAQRAPLFEAVADLTLDATQPPPQLVQAILAER